MQQELFSGKVKMIGKEDGGLYILSNKIDKEDDAVLSVRHSEHSDRQTEKIDIQLLHKRLGHSSSSKLKKLLNTSLEDITKSISKCTVCPCAKQTRMSFPISTSSSLSIFDLLHMDLWGPYKKPTFDGFKYFLTIVDDNSRMTWVFLLRMKSNVCTMLKTYLTYVKTQFNKQVKVIRSDNGTEFVNTNCSELFIELGIIHQTSCAYTPQQNGIAERKHKHILEITRAIRFQANIPIMFWGLCVKAAVYIINRMPSSVIADMSPFEKTVQ